MYFRPCLRLRIFCAHKSQILRSTWDFQGNFTIQVRKRGLPVPIRPLFRIAYLSCSHLPTSPLPLPLFSSYPVPFSILLLTYKILMVPSLFTMVLSNDFFFLLNYSLHLGKCISNKHSAQLNFTKCTLCGPSTQGMLPGSHPRVFPSLAFLRGNHYPTSAIIHLFACL